jgi:hypothetical protein
MNEHEDPIEQDADIEYLGQDDAYEPETVILMMSKIMISMVV